MGGAAVALGDEVVPPVDDASSIVATPEIGLSGVNKYPEAAAEP